MKHCTNKYCTWKAVYDEHKSPCKDCKSNEEYKVETVYNLKDKMEDK